jgi:hypothetical protein
MASNAPDSLHQRGNSLEEEFFRREDQRLLDRMKQQAEAQSAREALAQASGITNPAVLDRLMELNIRAETVAALALVPLVEVAWADGTLDAKEREAVLAAARETGLAPDSVEHSLLAAWLDRRPEQRLVVAWSHMVRGMCEKLAPEEITKLKSALLDRARTVARASGGMLGLGSKVSSAEALVLTKLEGAFATKK